MCLQASRAVARLDEKGNIVLLQDQNRTLWNKALIEKGYEFLDKSGEGQNYSEYHLEAAIAATHAQAKTFEQTNWSRIVELYQILLTLKPDPIVELNLAIALSKAQSVKVGLQKLQSIKGLEQNSIYHAALGDFHAQLQQPEKAMLCYQKALPLTHLKAEQILLHAKMARLKE